MPSILLVYASDSACPWFRFLLPARFCGPDFAPSGCEIKVGPYLEPGHDWVGVHGLPTPDFLFEILKTQRAGTKFLWSLDDDFLTIPASNPAKPGDMGLSVHRIARLAADAILCSTPALAATFADVGDKVHVAPNLIDLAAFPPWEEGQATTEITLPVKIGWFGGPTHRDDVARLSTPLGRILDRFAESGEAQVAWFGPLPPSSLLKGYLRKGLIYQPMEPFQNYQLMINSIKPDICLAPLDPCPFNASKSSLRIMEAWSLRAVPVATPHGEYNCIRSGVDGRYASSDDEWYSAIARLTTDHAYRLELARNGRYRVGVQYDWNNFVCRRPWLEFFAHLFGVPVPEKPGYHVSVT